MANCQVAVFASLSNVDYSSLIDARLYLPQDWCNYPARCDEAGVTEDERTFKSKAQLAWEIIEHQSRQIDFDFVSADGFYGNDAELARRIDEAGYLYMLDIHSDQTIYLSRPELFIHSCKSARGRTPQKLKASTEGTTACEYLKMLQPKRWQEITVRNTAKGVLTGFYHFANVWIWNKAVERIEPRLLVIRKTYNPKGEEGRNKVLLNQCQLRPIYAPRVGLHAGRTFFRGAQHQGIEADTRAGPVSNPEVERLAAPGGFKLSGFILYPERKTPKQGGDSVVEC